MKLKLITTILMLNIANLLSAEFFTNIKSQYYTGFKFDNESSFGLGVGYNFMDQHSVEIEFSLNGFDSTDPGFELDADLPTFLLNYDYTLYKEDRVKVIGGFGIGLSDAEFYSAPTVKSSDTIMTYHVGLGASYNFYEDWQLGLGARYQNFEDLEANNFKYELGSGAVFELSLAYQF